MCVFLQIIIFDLLTVVFCLEQAKESAMNDGGMEEGFSTFEMRQSRRGTMSSKRGTMKSTTTRRSSNLAMISSRAPPRPTPGMVNYSDEDSAKGYDENPDDSDSLTEKPSEISSTSSQVRKRKKNNIELKR